jgi:hypothetical protein
MEKVGRCVKAWESDMVAKDERERRLAEALRQNLRRRKAQAREAVPPPPTPDTAED